MTGGFVVSRATQRLTKQETQMIRDAVASGQPVQFLDRHQWRHFTVRSS